MKLTRIHRVLGLCAVIIAGLASVSQAATELAWDRNADADMKEYKVYACLTAGCTASKVSPLAGVVAQPAAGVVPVWLLPVNAVGAAVVTAVDTDGNESGASNMVSFDTKAPAAPSNVRTR